MSEVIRDNPLEGDYDDSEDVPAPFPFYKRADTGRPSKCTPDLLEKVCELIRRGTYKHVAAMACGISPSTLYRWLRDPSQKDVREQLYAVEAAARADAEHRIFAEKPSLWLTRGPGRDRGDPDQPGWTLAPKEIRIEGAIEHSAAVPDTSRLSEAERRQLLEITSKMLPGARRGEVIAIDAGDRSLGRDPQGITTAHSATD